MAHPLARPFLLLPFVVAMATASAADPGPLAPVLQKSIDRHIVSGAVGLVADRDHVLDLEAVGESSVNAHTPMQTDSLFYIASMTKTFTGAAVMMLVDEGKLTLDDPVEKYLPEFKGQMVVEDKQPPHPPKHPITVREIMSHTSGLTGSDDPDVKRFFTLKEAVATIASKPLQWEPGTKYKYNNSGINTGARLVEVLSGVPFTDFLQKRLFTPLELKDTTYWPDEALAKRLANTTAMTADKSGREDILDAKDLTTEARQKFSQGVKVPQPMLNNFGQQMLFNYGHHFGEGSHGICSTASDIGRFCQMLLNRGEWQGRRYLSEEAVKQMGAIQTGEAPTPPELAYGIGVFVIKKDDQGPSVGSFGHFGARKTCMWIDPKNQIVMVLMVQSSDMTKEQQKELYSTFFQTAVEKFGWKGE
ncbi:MAG: serine hydrolase domain-containing protein [Chthoniobacter sp.]|uniref:serine hydrolase domain-containing protein n=1 Tax=Chthoniobacter sp. TaxID=2510640 RepID=UPI0032A8A6DD